jgi:hypothetical protein
MSVQVAAACRPSATSAEHHAAASGCEHRVQLHRFEVHARDPQLWPQRQAARIAHEGSLAAVPTDDGQAPVRRLDDMVATESGALRRHGRVQAEHHPGTA